MNDDYNTLKKIATEARIEHEETILKVGQGKPFSPMVRRTDHFFTNKETHMEDPILPPKEIPKKPRMFETLEVPMKLGFAGRTGHNSSFNAFPEYMEDPKKEVVRKAPEEDPLPGVRTGFKAKSKPTPSIACNIRNLKSSYPTAFSRSPSCSPRSFGN